MPSACYDRDQAPCLQNAQVLISYGPADDCRLRQLLGGAEGCVARSGSSIATRAGRPIFAALTAFFLSQAIGLCVDIGDRGVVSKRSRIAVVKTASPNAFPRSLKLLFEVENDN